MAKRRPEYVWKEKKECPYCKKMITESVRFTKHISKRHPEQFHDYMEKCKADYMANLNALKEAGAFTQ